MKTAKQIDREMKRKLELKRKLKELALNILLVIIAVMCIATLATSKAEIGQVNTIEHVVKAGENLTQIADKYYEDEYLPKALCDIKKLNNMTESDLQVGQVILVRN